jgi:peptidyl-prolyl cis-trans isomerase D
MVLMWMKKQAPWVIGTFGVLILVGLLWMDRAQSWSGQRNHNIVGEVDGEELPTERFQAELKNYLRNEEARNGKAPEGVALIQFREGLFNYKVQSILMERIFKDYELHASVDEMRDYLEKHPQELAMYINRYEGPDQIPAFLRDSTIDQARYVAWLSQDSVYDRVALRAMEEQLSQTVVPQLQLQQLMKAQLHATALEETFSLGLRENKARLKYYRVSADSFPVAADRFKDADLKAYFEAHPDSFHFAQDAARLQYVRIPIQPSRSDTALMDSLARAIKKQVQEGETFADLAKSYSNDAATAEKGGKLEGYRTKEGLDPAFAAAAWALKPGEISDPVLTQFGYHVIQLNGKKGEDSADISHILLQITSGNETTDSLIALGEKIRADAKKVGLEKAAQAAGLKMEKTPIFDRTNNAPLGRYVQGANSFAFSKFEEKEKVSEPLQAEDGVYIFARDAAFAKGRNFDRAKERIAEILVKEEKQALARKELEAHKGEIASATVLPAAVGKAVLDSTAAGAISADNWLPGFGYGSPALLKVFAQPVGQWGPVLATEQGAVMARVEEKAFLSDAELAQKAAAAPPQNENFTLSTLVQTWTADLPKTAKVENKLDMVFRN